ncbi:MAG TPA: thiamine pyrophosphate-binding protein [Candidatus Binatia bacterium]|nr:thiamine pyrophosphate-binding protein [Candidatus Binatia bacterium]
MRGKQVLMDSLIGHGIEYLFGNPGTTESPIIDSLPDYPQLRYVLALHEGVALGAASFYAQASGRAAVVNLHVAPGLGNALGMLYGALKAGSPLLVTAGQQDTRMRLRDPLLGHDLAAMAAPVTKWSLQIERADELAPALHRALKVASDPPSGPVFMALPIDVLEQETDQGARPPGALYRRAQPDPAGVTAAARALLASRSPVIVAGDDVARAGGSQDLLALAERLGAGVWFEGLRQHVVVPSSHPSSQGPLPFDAGAIRKALDGADAVLMVGGPFFEEVWFSPGSTFPEDAALIQIEDAPARLGRNFPLRIGLLGDPAAGLRAIGAAVEAGADAAFREAAARRNAALRERKEQEIVAQRERAAKRWDREPIAIPRLMADLAAALPPEAIVVDESITASIDLARTLRFARPGDYYGARGGGIGQALPGALGVKIAHPGRPVVAISGDGSAMYSIQALWTAAHHDLGVVFVVVDNREYRVLKHNMDAYRQRFGVRPGRPYVQMDLTKPELGFVDIAQGMGVAAARVTRPGDLRPALEAALAAGRPYVLDVVVEGKA